MNNNLKINKNDFSVYIFFFLISLCKGIGLNNGNEIYLIIYLIGMCLATIKLLKIGFNKKELISILSILFIGLIDFFIAKETTILFTGITLAFLKKSNLRNVIKALFLGRVIGLIFMIALPVSGILKMNIVSFYRNGEFIKRYAFGYSHPNLMHSTFNIVVIMWLYLNYEKINLKNICICGILNYILYKYTYSRTGFLLLGVFLIIAYFTKKSKKIQEKIPKCLNIIFLCSILIGVILAYGYGKFEIVSKFDTILTGRIKYLSILIKNYFPPLIKIHSYQNILFDNGYFDLLYNGGILATIWYIYMQLKTNSIIREKKMYTEALVIIIFMIYSITESYYASSIMNIGIIFFSYALYSSSNLTIKD